MASLQIIGGTGFFGKSILDAYKRGMLNKWKIEKIYVVSRNPQILLKQAPELLGNGIELYTADISTANAIPVTDYIIHAAASTDAKSYLSNPKQECENLINATKNFCMIIKNSALYKKSKIVYASSGAVYGKNSDPAIFFDESSSFNSTGLLAPNKILYAQAKQEAENIFANLSLEGYFVSIARCFAFTGKYLPKNQHFAIGNFIENGLHHEPVKVFADNAVYRSYLHSDDLVQWLMSIAHGSVESCEIYNVGSDQAIELHDLGRLIAKKFNVDCQINPINSSLDPDVYLPNINKAIKNLGLEIKIGIDEAISLSV